MKQPSPERSLPVHPLILLHRILRGRYLIAIVIGVMLAGLFAATAYKLARPKFSSTGMLRVAPVLPKILYGNEDNEQLPQFDSYLVAQMQLVSSRPVLELAVADPAMREIGWREGPEGVVDLGRRLNVVKGGPRSELIEISVTDERPLAAMHAVNSVLDAFVAHSGARREQTATLRESTLLTRQRDLHDELADVEKRLLAAAGEYGPNNLDRVHSSKVSDIERLDNKIADLDNNIAEQEAKKNAAVASEESDDEVKRLTIADHAMANLLLRRADRVADLDRVLLVYGSEHPQVKAARTSLESIDHAIQRRMEQLATLGKTGVLTSQKADSNDDQPVELLRQLRLNMIAMRAQSAEESIQLGVRRFEVESLQLRRTELLNSLEDTQKRLDQIRVENRATQPGRVSVAVRGMVPVGPSQDRRRVAAAGGGAVGFLLAFVLCSLDRALRPRIRRADELDAVAGLAPVFGLVPKASSRGVNARVVQHQVSLLRSRIETQKPPGDTAQVILVTSGMGREGKTNIALALARSFASGGRRTLLVDGDIRGGGLTRLLSLEHVPGLLDAMQAGQSSAEHWVSDRPGLAVLPTGRPADDASDALSQQRLRALLEAAQSRFDVIILDSEPCVVSPVTRLLHSMASQVLLVTRRGQLKRAFHAALTELTAASEAPVGVVLNCADMVDCESAQYANRETQNTNFALSLAVS